jgi:uncharacterized membrane protein
VVVYVYVKSAINYSQWLSFSILITAILSVQITDHTSFGPKQAVLAATTSTASTSTTLLLPQFLAVVGLESAASHNITMSNKEQQPPPHHQCSEFVCIG